MELEEVYAEVWALHKLIPPPLNKEGWIGAQYGGGVASRTMDSVVIQ